MTVKGESENYEKIIAEQLTRIGDILTAAFQGQIMQYNNTVKVAQEGIQLKEAYSKLSLAYNELKTKEKEDADNN
jgi:hypothetical protein